MYQPQGYTQNLEAQLKGGFYAKKKTPPSERPFASEKKAICNYFFGKVQGMIKTVTFPNIIIPQK